MVLDCALQRGSGSLGEAILDSAADAVISLDEHGRAVVLNVCPSDSSTSTGPKRSAGRSPRTSTDAGRDADRASAVAKALRFSLID
jgi:hypothetical protein